jgi:hypothetical protein
MMGELVGMAASVCKKHSTTPRGVYQDHLDELKALARLGVGKNAPGSHNYGGQELGKSFAHENVDIKVETYAGHIVEKFR